MTKLRRQFKPLEGRMASWAGFCGGSHTHAAAVLERLRQRGSLPEDLRGRLSALIEHIRELCDAAHLDRQGWSFEEGKALDASARSLHLEASGLIDELDTAFSLALEGKPEADRRYMALAGDRVRLLRAEERVLRRQMELVKKGSPLKVKEEFEALDKRFREFEADLRVVDASMRELSSSIGRDVERAAERLASVENDLGNKGFVKMTAEGVDLSGQFQEEVRDQGQVGTCSIFAAVGLLEAALAREDGETIDLSEMWVARLQAKKFLASSSDWYMCTSCSFCIYDSDDGSMGALSMFQEGGICREQTLPYVSSRMGSLEEDRTKPGIIDRYWRGIRNLSPTSAKAIVKEREALLYSLFLPDSDPRIQACRAEAAGLADRIKDMESVSFGGPTVADILESLDLGLPLAIGLDSTTERPSELISVGGSHALLVVGYDMGKRVFRIRNSWGTWDPNYVFYGGELSFDQARASSTDRARPIVDAIIFLSPKDRSRLCVETGGRLPGGLQLACD
ncbi:MAG: C1 family peptidase [Elusimicrobiota bacterium]